MVKIKKPLNLYGDKGHERTYEMTHKAFERHVIREEPVRSFRFHGNTVQKVYEKGLEIIRPGFMTFNPKERASFAYTSAYAYTLTWTPGHLTLVGDLGEMTIVHYHAMPTLEAACRWVLNSDFDYLMQKTNVQQVFDRSATCEYIWQVIMERTAEGLKYLKEEKDRWLKEKPKWLKSKGMRKDEFEQEMRCWQDDDPVKQYGITEVKEPSRHIPRSLWSAEDKRGWSVPDEFEMLFRLWKFLYGEDEVFFRPNELLEEARIADLKDAFEHWCDSRANDEIVGMIVRDLEYDDYYGEYRYDDGYVWKMAAIQLGAQMILEQIERGRPAPAPEPEEAIVAAA